MSINQRPTGPAKMLLTRAELCPSGGNLQIAVRSEWVQNCSGFLRRQAAIIRLKVVVTLGRRALRATQTAFDILFERLSDAVADRNGKVVGNSTRLVAVYHPGRRALIIRSYGMQHQDWNRVRAALEN